ncbi:hypothetical protein Droror1_Dr00000906 [Drosera rotundifolia]
MSCRCWNKKGKGISVADGGSEESLGLAKEDWATQEGIEPVSPVFTFGNQAGLDMLETTLVTLQDIIPDKVLDEARRKMPCSEFGKIIYYVLQ